MKTPESIDDYLDALAGELLVPASRLRRIVAETDDHLRAAAAELQVQGIEAAEAEKAAIARFGSPLIVARSYREAILLSPALLYQLVVPLMGLAAVGLIAIGLSGLLALAMGMVAGKDYVAGNGPGVTYTAERCGEFLEYFPKASSCEAAAVSHHFEEVVFDRVVVGVLGVLTLGAYLLLKRSLPSSKLPRVFVPTIGASLFGVAALGLLFIGLMQTMFGTPGQVGAQLSGGIVAAAVCAAYALVLLPVLSSQST